MEATSHSCSSKDFFSFRRSNNSACIAWRVKDFSTLKEKRYTSPEFRFKGVRWHLTVYPFGDEEECEGDIGLFLMPHLSLPLELKYQFFAKNETGEDSETNETTRNNFSGGKGYGFRKFLNRQDLLDGRLGEFLPCDVLTIYCTMRVVKDFKTESETSTDTNETPPKKVRKLERDSSISKFRHMLDSGKFSDVVLRVGEEAIPAHKLILSTNSEVFQAMFDSNMKENRENIVDLVDMDSTVAKAMLLHMYTKEMEELDSEKTLALYIAADRYILTELKDKCREYVTKNLSLENVGEVFEIAKLHSDDVLLEAAKNFFANNVRSILKSKKWKEYSACNLSSSLELVSYAITSNDLFFLK